MLTRDYQVTLKQVILLGKADEQSKAASLSETVAQLSEEVATLRKQVETAKAVASEFEAKCLASQCSVELLGAEKAHLAHAREEAEAAAKQARDLVAAPLKEKG